MVKKAVDRRRFIQDKYLPKGFFLKDPQNLTLQEIKTFIQFLQDRESTLAPSQVFRFRAVKTRRKGGEIVKSMYPDQITSKNPPIIWKNVEKETTGTRNKPDSSSSSESEGDQVEREQALNDDWDSAHLQENSAQLQTSHDPNHGPTANAVPTQTQCPDPNEVLAMPIGPQNKHTPDLLRGTEGWIPFITEQPYQMTGQVWPVPNPPDTSNPLSIEQYQWNTHTSQIQPNQTSGAAWQAFQSGFIEGNTMPVTSFQPQMDHRMSYWSDLGLDFDFGAQYPSNHNDGIDYGVYIDQCVRRGFEEELLTQSHTQGQSSIPNSNDPTSTNDMRQTPMTTEIGKHKKVGRRADDIAREEAEIIAADMRSSKRQRKERVRES